MLPNLSHGQGNAGSMATASAHDLLRVRRRRWARAIVILLALIYVSGTLWQPELLNVGLLDTPLSAHSKIHRRLRGPDRGAWQGA